MNVQSQLGQFRAAMKPRPATPPDVDLDHPDAEILEAFENLRRLRVWAYTMETINQKRWPEGEAERVATEDQELELGVTGNFATTPAGVAAQLMALVPTMDEDRSVDRTLMEGGFLALHRRTKNMGRPLQIAMNAIRSLLEMEWEHALAEYEIMARDVDLVRSINVLITGEEFRTRSSSEDLSPFVEGVGELRSQIEERLNVGAAARLMRTLTPCLSAYQQKAAIAIACDMTAEAAPWLMRDVNFLMGELDAAAT